MYYKDSHRSLMEAISSFHRESTLKEAAWESGLKDDEPRIVSGVKGANSKPFKKKFRNQAAMEKWMDSEEFGDYEVERVERA